MKRLWLLIILSLCLHTSVWAQFDEGNDFGDDSNFGNIDDPDNVRGNSGQKRSTWGRDTSKVDRTVPTEFFQWRIDERLGNIERQEFNDTLPHLFHNFNATDGYSGEYNILGNLGSPRMARRFFDRNLLDDFMFIQPYDYFHTTPGNLLFTNTKSPVTNLQYHECGSKQNGQDRVRGYFATNINKQAGLGFKVDYLYARGYYNNQANSQFGGTLFGYYQSDQYDIHAMASWEHMKMGENGGITDDAYITNPESFPRSVGSKDIPTALDAVFNRNDIQTYYLNHRYNLGFYRDIEVPDSLKPVMPDDTDLLKRIQNDSLQTVFREDSVQRNLALDSLRQLWKSEQVPPREFIPVTSFLHTLHIRNLQHEIYNRSTINETFFGHAPYLRAGYGDFGDETTALSVSNTFGIQLREGFNKWAKAGITLFAAHEYKRFKMLSAETTVTDDVFETDVENHISVGGEIQKTQGSLLHYNARGEFWVAGPDIGSMELSGNGDLNFRLGKDTLHLAASAFFKNVNPSFFLNKYHSQAVWWDNNLYNETRTRVEGRLEYDRTHTTLSFGVENITNYAYLATVWRPNYASDGTKISSYGRDVQVLQHGSGIQVLSASLRQNIHWGIFHWDSEVTWQHSTSEDALPLPVLSIYTNPYITFTIAKVLRVELGADMRYFTSYYAPDYAPFINQFAVQDASQERVKIGNYPILNGYVNLAIKRVRGYVNVTHFNAGSGNAFWAPHYPIDPMSIHFGLSWNFYD